MATVAEIIIKAVDQATTVMKTIERQGKDLGASLQGALGGLGTIGAGFLGIGAAGLTGFGMATKAAADLQSELKNTMTMTGTTGAEFDRVEKIVGQLASTMAQDLGISGKEVVKSFYYVLSTGVKPTEEGFKILAESALKLSKMLKIDTSTAVTYLADTTKIWGKAMTETAHTADVLFKASQLGNTTVPLLADAMREGGKAAASLGISMEETAAMMVAFSDKGVKGAEAGTAFRMVMLRLAAPPKDAANALKTLGVAIYDTSGKMRPMTTILQEIQLNLKRFTSEQQNAILKAIAGEDAFSKFAGILAGSIPQIAAHADIMRQEAALAAGFAETQKTLNFQLDRMKIALGQVAVAIGQQLIPMITPAIEKVTAWINIVKEYLKTHPEMMKNVAVWGAIGAAVSLAAGVIMVTIAKIGTAALTIVASLASIVAAIPAVITGLAAIAPAIAPIIVIATAMVATIALVSGAVYLLYTAWTQNWGGIQQKTQQVIAAITPYFQMILAKAQELIAYFQAQFAPVWAQIWSYIVQEFNNFWNEFGPSLTELWTEVQSLLGLIWAYIQPYMPMVMDWITETIKAAIRFWKTDLEGFFVFFKTAWETTKLILTTVVIPLFSAILKTIQDFMVLAKTALSWANELYQTYLVKPLFEASNKIKGILVTVAQAFNTIKGAITAALSAINATVTAWYNSTFGGLIKKLNELQALIDKIRGKQSQVSTTGSGAGAAAGSKASTSGTSSGGANTVIIHGNVISSSSTMRSLEGEINKYAGQRLARGMV